MSSTRLIKLLRKEGWVEIPQKGTSHRQFKHPEKPGKVTIPHPKKDIPIGTLNSIMKQAGLK